ncbi:MAG: secretin N-terminal domain-containing protein [Candidatus Sumerlaeia bacterium]
MSLTQVRSRSLVPKVLLVLMVMSTLVTSAFSQENAPDWKSTPETKDENRIDLTLDNKPIEMAISVLSAGLKKTIIIGEGLRQRPVSAYFQNVPVEDALKSFCAAQLLVPIEQNGCIVLVTRNEYLSIYAPTKIVSVRNADPSMLAAVLSDMIQKSELIQVTFDSRTRNLVLHGDPVQIEQMQKTAESLDKALRREVFQIRYASVNNIAATLNDTLYPNTTSAPHTPGSAGASSASRNGYGNVIVDERSNQLIVCETPDNIECCRSIIQKLDIPIETRVFSTGNIDPSVVADQIRKGELGNNNANSSSSSSSSSSRPNNSSSSSSSYGSNSSLKRLSSDATVQVIDGTNQIMVTDTPERLAILEKVMRELNRNIETIVIQPKNGLPTDLSEVVKGAYSNLTVSVDMRSNSIVLTGHHDRVEQAKELIEKLDAEQNIKVEIESKIMLVSTSKLKSLGVHFYNANLGTSDESLMDLSINSNFPADSVKKNGATMGHATGSTLDNPTKSSGNFLEALQPNIGIQAVVRALESDGDTQLLSNPRLQMLAGQTSTFFSGSREPYSETTLQNDTSVQNVKFIDVGVNFEVTPLVRPDFGMTIEVSTEYSNLSDIRDGIPVVDTRKAHSIIEAAPEETILIGGLMSQETTKGNDGIPYLRRIPGLNYFFSEKNHSHVEREMVISITPRILKSDYSFTANGQYKNIHNTFEMPAVEGTETTSTLKNVAPAPTSMRILIEDVKPSAKPSEKK